MNAAALLGVERSVLGNRWSARLDEAGEREAAAIVQTAGLPDMLARVLAGRGVSSAGVESYLEPRLRDLLPDPSALIDMDRAVDRLVRAVVHGERVAIIGDYDVDGACAAALVSGFLRAHGLAPKIHIPDRLTEGYGPNVEVVRTLATDGYSLLVTVDCGTTSGEALAEARALGMEVIVIDHHQAPEALPPAAAIVNPNRQDDLSGLGQLCAAGVVFMVLVGLARGLRRAGRSAAPDLMDELDIVALATVADVVPLTGLNRAFVRQGLKIMARRGRPGLRALCDAAGLREAPAAYHLGFVLGPRINAGGRIGDAALGARLLLTTDEAEAARIAGELDTLNRDRQAIESGMLADAEEQAALAQRLAGDANDAPVLVIASETFHPGVVGIVAARLKERFRRPALVIALGADGFGSGSARSVAGVDVGRIVRGLVETGLLRKGGGHAMAAGITVAADRIDELRRALVTAVAAQLDGSGPVQPLSIDGLLSSRGATAELATALERAGPFGQGNPEPLFCFAAHRLQDVRVVGENHVRARLLAPDGFGIPAIAFRSVGTALGDMLLRGGDHAFHILGALGLDRGSAGRRPELRMLDGAPAACGRNSLD